MAKIIRHGKPPKLNKYEYECPNCHALVIYDCTDVKNNEDGDYRNYPFEKVVICPEEGCGCEIKWANIVNNGIIV